MTIQITKPEIEVLLKRRLQSGEFKDAEDVILQALRALEPTPECVAAERAAAVERLKTFGKRHGLSLGGMTIRELRDKARP
jgi:Arc/MetJ-type ribon-helix-helix transcriptional regulator